MLFHLADEAEWRSARERGGPYERSMPGVALADVGFVHLSYAFQVQATADRHYRGRGGLVLLGIDPERVAAPVRVEDGFPHLHGPLDLDAVVAERPVPVRPDGRLDTGFAAPLVHVNLDVADVDRSVAFWGRWFGFDHGRETVSDGTVFVRDATGFDLAFHPGRPRPEGFHVGLRAEHPDVVRSLHGAAVDAGVPVTETWDAPDYVTVKLLDPDGYEVEVYWSPPTSPDRPA